VDRPPEVVEYVDGPWNGTTEERSVLPETITVPDGRYVRSVRWTDDGSLRYVRHGSEPAEQGHEIGMKEG
jgi:hypothetical protein